MKKERKGAVTERKATILCPERSLPMVDPLTFLTQLYVMVDDFCQSQLPREPHPGPNPALCRSEVITLALFAQWAAFTSERDFHRWAQRHGRAAFPHLPDRSQFNRQMRAHWRAI